MAVAAVIASRSDGETEMESHIQWLDELLRKEHPLFDNMLGKSGSLLLTDSHLSILSLNNYYLSTFLKRIGLIRNSVQCPRCNRQMTFTEQKRSTDGYRWICGRRLPTTLKCGLGKTIRDGSWFVNAHMPMALTLRLTRLILRGHSGDNIHAELKISPTTISDWRQLIEEVLVEHFINNSQPLGGEGVIVEIDESKFGKRKYNRGRQVEGQWFLCGIERGGRGRVFLVPLPDNSRSADVLIPIIEEYVLPGSVIMTDCWKGYSSLGITSYRHFTVNNSKFFVDPITGEHNNIIEGLWRHVKEKIPGPNRQPQFFTNKLGRYVFERHCKRRGTDVFVSFIDIIRRIRWTPTGSAQKTTIDIQDDDDQDNILLDTEDSIVLVIT